MFRVFIVCLIVSGTLFAQEIKLLKEQYIKVDFESSIKSIRVSNEDILFVEYGKDTKKPFTQLIVYGKDYGKANIFITYNSGDSESFWFRVSKDLDIVKSTLQLKNSTVSLDEYNRDKFILRGDFNDKKEKDKILTILKRSDINTSKDVIDISTVENFPPVVKIKMYIVEISNQSLDEFKSNMILRDIVGDTTVDINMIVDQSLTLDGMFTSAIKHMGSQFNITNALKILKQKQLANILDESTLSVMEGERTLFHSGGTIYVRVQGTTSEGQPISTLKELEYGIKLDIFLNELNQNNNSMLMTIDTEKTSIDWDKQVDNIPGFGKKSIVTKIAAWDNQVIILSGLVSSEDSKVIKKIPILGNIPILGKLFSSESFKKGKSELMFFLIPEVQKRKS